MSQESIDTFKRMLTEKDYRITKARMRTFKLLLNNDPQSMNEIIVKSKGRPDRVSIYRTIELFEKLGIAHRINNGWKYKIELSEQFIGHHHHITCIDCGVSKDIEDEQHIDHYIHESAERAGFTPLRHVFEIEGRCSACQALLNE